MPERAEPDVIFCSMPRYDTAELASVFAFMQPSKTLKTTRGYFGGSLISRVFSEGWRRAVLYGYRYFAMLHADIVPEENWLDKLWAELHRLGDADIVSCVVPIKHNNGETSTAYWPDGAWSRKRLTLQEAIDAGPSFSEFKGKPVMVNTGCWLAKFGDYPGLQDEESIQQWLTRTPRDQWPWQCLDFGEQYSRGFEINTKFDWPNGRIISNSEDWLLSEWLLAKGGKAYATTVVKLDHIGKSAWPNYIEEPSEVGA